MITVITGKNNYVLREKKWQIINVFVKEYGDLSVERFDSTSSEQIIYDALHTVPFLVDKKLVIIDEPSANKGLLDGLMNWLTSTSDKIDVLIVETSPDKRTAWYKFISQKTNVISCSEPDERGLLQWMKQFVIDNGGTLEPQAGQALIRNVGLNQEQLANEIQKLLNYSLVITKDAVNLLVDPMPQDTVFGLLEALTEGDVARTMDLFDRLRLYGIDANEIIAMIGWQIHILALVKSSMDATQSDSGLHPFVIQKNMRLARRLSLAQIERLLTTIINAELHIKRDGLAAQSVVMVLLHQMLAQLK